MPAQPTTPRLGTATSHVGPSLLVGNANSLHQPAARHGNVPRGTEPSGREYQLSPPTRSPARQRPTWDRAFWSGIPAQPPPLSLARRRPTWDRAFWSGMPAQPTTPRLGTVTSHVGQIRMVGNTGSAPPSARHGDVPRGTETSGREYRLTPPACGPARQRPTWDRAFRSGIPAAHPTSPRPGTATSHVGPSLLVGNANSLHQPAARHGDVPRGTEPSGRECRLSPPPLSPAR